MFRRIWALVRKEMKSYFDSPVAYVLLIVWLVTVSYFFFRAAFLMKEASLRPLFEILPWLLLFFIPAVTMRSLAAEKKDGTLEVLLTQPISEVEVIAGKLMANVIFVFIALALTLPIPIGLSLGGRLDLGMLAGEYLGAGFLIVGLVSVGLFASSLSRNQTIAFIIALFLTFILIATGLEFVLMAIPFSFSSIVRQISALAHFDSMIRGIINLSDIVYFVALTVIFSTLSYFGLRQDRESRSSARYKSLRLGMILIIVVSVLGSLIGTAIGGRVDLTDGRLYSLSGATLKIVQGVPDMVTIKLYSSRQLPTETEGMLRDIKDKVLDYQAAGRGRVKAIFKSPRDDAKGQQEIQEAGVQLVQFNVIRQDETQIKKGFLGLTVEYQDKRETIPFVSQTDNLEYQLSRMIMKLTAEKREKVAFLEGHSQPSMPSIGSNSGAQDTYDMWKAGLREQYEVIDLTIEKKKGIPGDISTVIIAGPTTDAVAYELKALEEHLGRGGSILALIDGVTVNQQMMSAEVNNNNFVEFVAGYGFNVKPHMLFDMRSNQMISAGGAGNYFSLPYPFWMKVGPASDDAIVRDIRAVTIPWAQPVTGKKSKPLLSTSNFAGVQTKDLNIMPDPEMSVDERDLDERVDAASRNLKGGGRMVVVGDSDFLKNRFVSAPDSGNIVFGQNAVDWLARDSSLTEIRSKTKQSRALVFPSERVRDLVRYLNLIGVPLMVAIVGGARLSRRRKLMRKVFGT